MVKLPWELMTPYSDFLKSLPTSSAGKDDEDEGDDDEVQAHHDSMQRLRVSPFSSKTTNTDLIRKLMRLHER
jgi:transcription initiation protein SPT3